MYVCTNIGMYIHTNKNSFTCIFLCAYGMTSQRLHDARMQSFTCINLKTAPYTPTNSRTLQATIQCNRATQNPRTATNLAVAAARSPLAAHCRRQFYHRRVDRVVFANYLGLSANCTPSDIINTNAAC